MLRHHRIAAPELAGAAPRPGDVSQDPKRRRAYDGEVACLTPKGRVYLPHRHRFLLGLEALRLQNVWYSASQESCVLEQFPQAFQYNLAGNAMEGCCLAAVILSCVCVISSQEEATAPLALPDAVAVASDSDDDVDDPLRSIWMP